MIYELRVYQPLPGKMAKLQNRFSDQVLSICGRHGIRSVGYFTTLLGESSRTAFQEDPSWHTVRDGPIVATVSSQILTPTAFSALK